MAIQLDSGTPRAAGGGGGRGGGTGPGGGWGGGGGGGEPPHTRITKPLATEKMSMTGWSFRKKL